jgi:carbamoylphosphate synthase large subunit
MQPKKNLKTVPKSQKSGPFKKKAITNFRPKVRSRHKTHNPLREQLPLFKFRSIIRLGSTTSTPETGPHVECNTIAAVKNSANKYLMKNCFKKAGVTTAAQYNTNELNNNEIYPIVAKHHFGSRGKGNYLLKSVQEFDKWKVGKQLSSYIFEKFYDYNREYRLHVTKNGCFYACRKMLKAETPKDQRWFRNDSNCTWIMEINPQFDKPSNWANIEVQCVKALLAVGLDVGACDVKVQSAKDSKGKVRPTPEFIVIEINSAPSFGTITTQKYLAEIPKILAAKKGV